MLRLPPGGRGLTHYFLSVRAPSSPHLSSSGVPDFLAHLPAAPQEPVRQVRPAVEAAVLLPASRWQRETRQAASRNLPALRLLRLRLLLPLVSLSGGQDNGRGGGASFFPPSTCSAPILWLPGNRAGEGKVILRSGRGHMTQGAGPRREGEEGEGAHEAKHRPSEDSEAAAAFHY